MTQQTPDALPGVTTSPSTTAPTPAAVQTTPTAPVTLEGTRFVAYDDTYLRFVGKPHDTKAKATKAAKDAGIKTFTVREV